MSSSYGKSATSCASGPRRSLDPFEPDLAVKIAILVPARIDLDVQEEMDLAAEQPGELLACAAADLLQPRTALAQHDRPLAVAGNEDLLMDRYRAVATFVVALALDAAGIGQLFMQLMVDLLAGNLRG